MQILIRTILGESKNLGRLQFQKILEIISIFRCFFSNKISNLKKKWINYLILISHEKLKERINPKMYQEKFVWFQKQIKTVLEAVTKHVQ